MAAGNVSLVIKARLKEINRIDLKELTARVEMLEKRAKERLEREPAGSDSPAVVSLFEHDPPEAKHVVLTFPHGRVCHEILVMRELSGTRLRVGRLEEQDSDNEVLAILPNNVA